MFEFMFVGLLMFLLSVIFARVAWGGQRQVPPPDKIAQHGNVTIYTHHDHDGVSLVIDDGSVTRGHIYDDRQRNDDRAARQVAQLRNTATIWGDDLVARAEMISADRDIANVQARLDRAQWLGIRNPDQDVKAVREVPRARGSFIPNSEFDIMIDDDRQPPAQPRYVDGFEMPPRTSPPNW